MRILLVMFPEDEGKYRSATKLILTMKPLSQRERRAVKHRNSAGDDSKERKIRVGCAHSRDLIASVET